MSAETADGVVTPRLEPVVRTVHEAFFPWGVAGDPVSRLNGVLADAKVELRRLVWLLLWAFELSPVFSQHARFSKLSLADRVAWLDGMRRSHGRFSRAVYPILKVLIQSMAYDEPSNAAALVTPEGS